MKKMTSFLRSLLPDRRYDLFRVGMFGLIVAGLLIVCGRLAVAAATAEAPPPAAGWTFGEVMALVALIVAGVGALVDAGRAVLHFTAPRTTTTLDDRAAAALDRLHERLTDIEHRLPPPSPAAPAARAPLGPVAMLVLAALGGSMALSSSSCAASQARAGAIVDGTVQCLKDDVPAAKTAGLQLATQLIAAVISGTRLAQVWQQAEDGAVAIAKAQGLAVGSCAFGDLLAEVSRWLPPPSSSRSVAPGAAAADPLGGGRAALVRLKARLGVTSIDTGAGVL